MAAASNPALVQRIELGVAVALVFGVAGLGIFGIHLLVGRFNGLESQVTTLKQHETTLSFQLQTSEARSQSLQATVDQLTLALAQKQQVASHQAVDEAFNDAGTLVHRTTVTATKQKTETAVHVATQQEAKTALTWAVIDAAATKDQAVVDTQQQTTEVFTPPRSGVNAGLLVSAAGVGPLVGLTVATLEPVHVDLAVGLVSGTSPRVGVGVSLEALPRLTVGGFALVAPAGDPLGVYHPALPAIGVAPGVGIQYRF